MTLISNIPKSVQTCCNDVSGTRIFWPDLWFNQFPGKVVPFLSVSDLSLLSISFSSSHSVCWRASLQSPAVTNTETSLSPMQSDQTLTKRRCHSSYIERSLLDKLQNYRTRGLPFTVLPLFMTSPTLVFSCLTPTCRDRSGVRWSQAAVALFRSV